TAASIDDFRWIRVAAIVAVAGFAVLLAVHLVRAGWTHLEAFGISLIIATLPPFQVHAMWAVHALTLPPCLLSGLAFGLVLRQRMQPDGERRGREGALLRRAAAERPLPVYRQRSAEDRADCHAGRSFHPRRPVVLPARPVPRARHAPGTAAAPAAGHVSSEPA